MCLSTVYRNKKDADHVAATYVASIRPDGNKIVLTDVMGFDTEIEGKLSFIDLTGGTVIIETEQE